MKRLAESHKVLKVPQHINLLPFQQFAFRQLTTGKVYVTKTRPEYRPEYGNFFHPGGVAQMFRTEPAELGLNHTDFIPGTLYHLEQEAPPKLSDAQRAAIKAQIQDLLQLLE